MNITEDYVSFEIAKLLKEKGFDCTVHQYYKENGEVCNNPKSVASWRVKTWCPCATHQMAMAWLREVHNIIIVVEPYMYHYSDSKTLSYLYSIWYGDNYDCKNEEYNSYEEAVEAALKFALENLV